jgi:hypothetical protein
LRQSEHPGADDRREDRRDDPRGTVNGLTIASD